MASPADAAAACGPNPAQVEAVFAELGRCVYLYQTMEHHLKSVLPFLATSDDKVPPQPGLAGNWRALLESKFLKDRRQVAIPFYEILKAISEAVVEVLREQVRSTCE